MLAVGTVLNGMYRIERHLSSGGFGNTYVAINLTFGDKVAVKEFFMRGVTQRDGDSTISVSNPDNRALFNEQLEKFKKEAQRIRRLQSPHIIRVHDMFDANGTAYYVMDYIDGESLSDRLKRTGKPLSEGEVRHYLAQVLDALEVIHSAGLYHMDLKPDNIIVDGSDRAVLIDFGASKRVSGSQMTMTATGVSYTNGYAPPEQMEQDTDHFGPWTDIYALGATLYKLLTNRKPPMPSAIYSDPTPDKHEVLPFTEGVSTNLRRVIVQMVAVRWNVRPQSIAALRNMLAQGEASFAGDERTEMIEDEVTRMQEPFHAAEIEREESYDDGEKSFSRKWIYAIVGVLLAVIAGGGYWAYNTMHNRKLKMEEQRLKQIKDSIDQVRKDSIDQAKKDSIAEVERIEQARLDSIENAKIIRENVYRAYDKTLYDISKDKVYDYIPDCDYFLYDITKDGIPELWVIKFGSIELENKLMVFTCLEGQSKLIYETSAGHSGFYEGKDYILKIWARQGSAIWDKLTYRNGKMVEKEIFREGPVDDYTQQKERDCKMYSYPNTQPIKKALGIE